MDTNATNDRNVDDYFINLGKHRLEYERLIM